MDGWIGLDWTGWILLRRLVLLEHLTVLIIANISRGGIFSRSLVFQAFSHVMVIIDEVSTLQRGPFANSGPHPAILLFDFPIIGPKKKVVVNHIYGCLNLSGEKYKCNEKRFSSIGPTSEEKNPKNHP